MRHRCVSTQAIPCEQIRLRRSLLGDLRRLPLSLQICADFRVTSSPAVCRHRRKAGRGSARGQAVAGPRVGAEVRQRDFRARPGLAADSGCPRPAAGLARALRHGASANFGRWAACAARPRNLPRSARAASGAGARGTSEVRPRAGPSTPRHAFRRAGRQSWRNRACGRRAAGEPSCGGGQGEDMGRVGSGSGLSTPPAPFQPVTKSAAAALTGQGASRQRHPSFRRLQRASARRPRSQPWPGGARRAAQQ